jgi:hypothetical protein
VKADGTETFVLKANRVEVKLDNDLITRAAISTLNEIFGTNIVINTETYQITGEMKATEASHYPNSGAYSNDNYGFENELRRAAKEWGPDIIAAATSGGGLDEFRWDGRQITGMLTMYRAEENRDQDLAKEYGFDLEFTHIDAHI